jgi:16S rRNA (cytidine1402-2'-O)-methyltransferase
VAAGTLYVVATPIGNLGDITVRALETLRAVDRVLAEDTRRTRGLLSHFGISGKPVDRLDANAEAHDVARAMTHLEAGESVALCTDAGTPIVSDPGTALVRAAVAAGATVVPIPGASAVLAAVALSGLVTGGFRFVGFLARSGPERREDIARIVETPESVVLFESPQRTADTLVELAQAMPDRDVVVARELTKLHEEAVRGTLAELAAQEKREWLGEVTIVLGPARARTGPGMSDEAIDARIDEELALGRRAKDVAEAIAIESGRPKREVYARIVARRG